MPQLASYISPLHVMKDAVSQGHIGIKSGKGLLNWPPERAALVLQRRKQELLRRRYAEKEVEIENPTPPA